MGVMQQTPSGDRVTRRLALRKQQATCTHPSVISLVDSEVCTVCERVFWLAVRR